MALSPPDKKPMTPPTVNPNLVGEVIDQGINLVNNGVEKIKSTAEGLINNFDQAAKKLKEFTQTKGSPTHVFSPRGEYSEMKIIKIKEFDPKQLEERIKKIMEEMNRKPGAVMREELRGESFESFELIHQETLRFLK